LRRGHHDERSETAGGARYPQGRRQHPELFQRRERGTRNGRTLGRRAAFAAAAARACADQQPGPLHLNGADSDLSGPEILMPLFSLITVTRNNQAGLQHTHESLQAQTCRDFEWIVIDGDSDDGTKSYLTATSALWLSEPDHGLYDAMNK